MKHPQRLQALVALVTVNLLCASSATLAQTAFRWFPVHSDRGTIRGLDCADSLNCMYSTYQTGIQMHVSKSTDGGFTWRTVLVDSGDGSIPRWPLFTFDIAYPTPDLAVVAADSGYFYRTTDGGSTWQQHRFMPTPYSCRAISMADGSFGVASVGYPSHIFVTEDGWESWTQIPDSLVYPPGAPQTAIRSIAAVATGTIVGIVQDSLQTLVRSTDRGRTWESRRPVLEGRSGFGTDALSFVDDRIGWSASETPRPELEKWQSTIARTSDGGWTWEVVLDTFLRGPEEGLAFADRENGIVAYANGVLRTTDGGSTWTDDSINLVAVPVRPVFGRGRPALIAANWDVIYKLLPDTIAMLAPMLPQPRFELAVIPNPARSSGRATLQVVSDHDGTARVSMLTPLGEIVRAAETVSINAGRNAIPLSLEGIGAGACFVRFELGGRQMFVPLLTR